MHKPSIARPDEYDRGALPNWALIALFEWQPVLPKDVLVVSAYHVARLVPKANHAA